MDSFKIALKCPLDEILGGGIETRTVTQLYGEPSSGKTNICLLAIVRAVEEGKKAVYIDTEGGHSLERLEQIAGKIFKKVLDSTFFFEPTEFKEQNEIIAKDIEKLVEKEKDIGIIVLDSAVSLYRCERDDENAQVMNRNLTMQVAKLSQLARKKNIACVLTAQVYSSYEGEGTEPVAGFVLKYWCKVIVELKKEKNCVEAILMKHKHMQEGIKARFKIAQSGIERC